MGSLGSNIAIALVIAILIGGVWLVHINRNHPVPGPLKEIQLSIAKSLCSPGVDICAVPLETLLQFPGAFNDTIVRTEGDLRLEFEGNSLYVAETSYADRDYRRSIWVWFSADQYHPLNGARVVVEGRFFGGKRSSEHYGGYGHMGLWYGEIEVASIERKANKARTLELLRHAKKLVFGAQELIADTERRREVLRERVHDPCW